jgi:hypothetical protein
VRIKNADKAKSLNATQDAVMEDWEHFRYGNKCDPQALTAIWYLRIALGLGPTGFKAGGKISGIGIARFYRDEFWRYVTHEYLRSWRKHDGTFFRKLADAMEVSMRPNDPVWTHVYSELICRLCRGDKVPTVTEMHKDMLQKGIAADRKTVGRIYRHLAVPRNARRGPRPGTKQQSVHRVRR